MYPYRVFRERYAKIWELYRHYKGEGRRVLRKGFNDYGVHDRPYPAFCPPNRPEYDIEHEAGCVFLAMLLFEFFPELCFGYNRAKVYELLLTHDVGEIKSGDISDDGNRNEAEKDSLEFGVYSGLFKGLTDGLDQLVESYEHFQRKDLPEAKFAYCIDKTEAVLQGLLYEQAGHGGSVNYKKVRYGLSAQDRENIRKTGSSRLVDIWFESVREKLKLHDPTRTFLELIEFAISDVRKTP